MDEVHEAFDDAFDGEIPDTLDREALYRMRTVAWIMDDCLRVPGTNVRFGLDPVLSVVPVVGDAVATGFALYIVLESANLGVGPKALVRMIANLTLDFAVGSIPVAGTVFDFFFRANDRNLALALDDLATGHEDDTEAVTIEVREP
jgi:hypothetical protein